MNRAHARLLLLLASTLTSAALGCGGGSTGGSGGSGNGGNGSTGGSAPNKGGSITVLQNPMGSAGEPANYVVGADFFGAPFADAGTTCTTTKEGACAVVQCMGSGAPNAPQVSAGSITVTVNGKSTTITAGANGVYNNGGMQGLLWMGAGDTVTAKAAGAEVPAFTLTTTTPGELAVVSPDFTQPSVNVSTAADFTMTWSGKSSGQVQLALLQLAVPPAPITNIACTFDASAGTGTVPASLMSKLPKGQGEIIAYSASVASSNDSGWEVSLSAAYPMVEGPINLQ